LGEQKRREKALLANHFFLHARNDENITLSVADDNHKNFATEPEKRVS
jgi:hypothetical protein